MNNIAVLNRMTCKPLPRHASIEPACPRRDTRYNAQFLGGPVVNRLLRWVSIGCVMGLGMMPVLKPQPAIAAERVVVSHGLLEFSLSRESLEVFEETGQVTGSLRTYARFLDDQALAEFRRLLQQRVDLDPVVVSQLTYSLMGEGVLQKLGQIVQTEARLNGFNALRAALILASVDPDGFAVINVIEAFPSPAIRIRGEQLLTLRREFSALLDYRDATVVAIQTEMEQEIAAQPLDLSQFPDFSQLGPYPVTEQILSLNRDRQTLQGSSIPRNFRVLLYQPQGLEQPAPVVVISHGLGSTPEAFSYLGEYLASYGFAAVIPQHIGSDQVRRDALVSGLLGNDISPVEFIDRPLDIRYTLDVLEQLSAPDGSLAGQLNVNQAAVIGHSFGGYTALALAGAPLNIPRIQALCDAPPVTLNAAPTLQCIANRLPHFPYQLQDSRIQAAIAISPTTSVVLGPESMSQIQIPTMLIAGSNDFVAAVVPEQIHPFLWMTAPQKYLAVMIPSGHSSADGTETTEIPRPLSALLVGPDPAQGREYIQQLSLAFLQRHVNHRPEYEALLSSGYARQISEPGLELTLVRSLTADDLVAAFGRRPPIPIVPEPVTPPIAANARSVLDIIAERGVLPVAIQPNTLPFATADAQGQLQGYCVELVQGLAQQLQEELGVPIRPEIVAQPDLSDRFTAVAQGTAYLECGPNTIRQDIDEVAFSTPFFLTGAHLLVQDGNDPRLSPFGPLRDLRLGVEDGSTTEAFVEQRYPEAEIVDFAGAIALREGVRAVLDGQIDAFAGDGVLLMGQAMELDLPPTAYSVIPNTPLTCEPYGLVLPRNDPRWAATVNRFIGSPDFRHRTERLFSDNLYPYILLNLDFCAG